LQLAKDAAVEVELDSFTPDACLINVMSRCAAFLASGQRRTDKRTDCFGVPGLRTFLFGGLKRTDKPKRVPVVHGDVVVWGGPARWYHGVLALSRGSILYWWVPHQSNFP
jgi:alkylated DNA repair protein (DNA oxidative demethylase)